MVIDKEEDKLYVKIDMNKISIPGGKLVKYAKEGDVGIDIRTTRKEVIWPRQLKMIHTGIYIKLPDNYEATIRQRSGLSLKYPNYISIGIGTIDSDYTGELMVPVFNHRFFKRIVFEKNERFAQMVISEVKRPKIQIVEKLKETERGSGGFGHTGKI